MKRKYGWLKLLALSCILFVCVTVIMSCSLHKSSPIDVGRNSKPAIVSVGGNESNIKDSQQGIVSTDAPIQANLNISEEKCFVSSDISQKDTIVSACTNIYSDLKSTDWAYGAIKSLVERYRVAQIYSDNTFRGSRAATRFEVADMLNSAMDRINELFGVSLKKKLERKFLTKRDMVELTESVKAASEIASEVATLRGRVDSLESRLTILEKLKMN